MSNGKEVNPQNTKNGLIAAIIRWFFVLLFFTLLIFALYIQTSWKIITLLLILIVGFALLPKPYRTRFCTVTSIIALAFIVWVILPDNNQGWRPYTFDKEAAALNAKYAVPEKENAEVIFTQLPEIFDDPSVTYIFQDNNNLSALIQNSWTAKEHPASADWLNNHKNIFDILLQINNYEKCFFQIKAAIAGDRNDINVNHAARKAAQLLAIAANYDIGNDRLDFALMKYQTMLHIGNLFIQNIEPMNKLVGSAIEAMALSELRSFIVKKNITPMQLDEIETSVSKVNCSWSSDFNQILEHDKLFTKNFIGNYYEINPGGRIRFTRDPMHLWREKYIHTLETTAPAEQDWYKWYHSIAYPPYWQKKLWKANVLLLWLSFPSNPETAGKIFENESKSYYETLQSNSIWGKNEKPINFSIFPVFTIEESNFRKFIKTVAENHKDSFNGMHKLYMRFVVDKNGTQIIAALKRYKDKNGSWPQNLSQIENLTAKENLVDLSNGEPFAYKLTDESFMLYSIGPNKIDENGNWDHDFDSESADDWPIWPQFSDPLWKK